ncbi:putative BCS1-mitochondrial protein of the AAA family of ATPase [Rosellinia necatrix]|uniref:Putative BCS1-mitochondrial protein of the AAA family of ATPase n=1 Tax=Rosellinia necatrix TaxID=77044 RepID=A0A1W2TFW9_ROSNE|nr:putative BCS1-mitochondrial protein of the AAA family of ATPase [Rosellinia necatrix]
MPQPFHIAGAAARPLLATNRAGINLIREILERTFSFIDPTRAEHALTIWNLTASVAPNLIELFYTLRHYTRVFFTSAVTIKAGDELYTQVFGWLAERERGSRHRFIKEYTAQTLSDVRVRSSSPGPGYARFRNQPQDPREPSHIKFTPAFRTTWFFWRWNLFAVLRNDKYSSNMDAPINAIPSYDYYGPVSSNSKDRESVTITCLGWSTTPIRSLLEACRDMAEAQRRTSVTIRSDREGAWAVSAVKPVRPLDTIHLHEDVKTNLINDIKAYLDPKRRRFYSENGIPYRRGYLLHGPPGCGKSSLSVALAGFFGLDLYIVNFSSLYEYELSSLFAMLPARCFVLLEDIDAVGFRQDDDEDENDNTDRWRRVHASRKCSFSSLLNILDGVASQEGRVVIMTSNFPEKLDEALVRPGRIDVKIHMGHITQEGAEQIFLRMMRIGRLDDKAVARYPGDFEHTKEDKVADEHPTEEELIVLAQRFAQQVPEKMLTPAQLQGYLLRYLHSATKAADGIADWVVAEKHKAEEKAREKDERAKRSEERRAEHEARREERRARRREKHRAAYDSDAVVETMDMPSLPSPSVSSRDDIVNIV